MPTAMGPHPRRRRWGLRTLASPVIRLRSLRELERAISRAMDTQEDVCSSAVELAVVGSNVRAAWSGLREAAAALMARHADAVQH